MVWRLVKNILIQGDQHSKEKKAQKSDGAKEDVEKWIR